MLQKYNEIFAKIGRLDACGTGAGAFCDPDETRLTKPDDAPPRSRDFRNGFLVKAASETGLRPQFRVFRLSVFRGRNPVADAVCRKS
ncbi:MAG: hypothetical protein JSS05_09085 [Proteobacteria bacterium]|nr:hypothetical protein [Pseudomonadota bacterium]